MSTTPPVASSSATPSGPVNRHAMTATERQKAQLDKLLKDPTKTAHMPAPPKEKTIRPAREMMKNVQGSSAGAGSGEFHVYKAGRRREYERLKLMEEQTTKERIDAEFERKRKEADDAAEAKTAKNRAKRQKKKQQSKKGGSSNDQNSSRSGQPGESRKADNDSAVPLKKRRLVNGKELVFRAPGEASDPEEDDGEGPTRAEDSADEGPQPDGTELHQAPPPVAAEPRIIIHDD